MVFLKISTTFVILYGKITFFCVSETIKVFSKNISSISSAATIDLSYFSNLLIFLFSTIYLEKSIVEIS